jgi:hypothetical protein
MKKMKHTAVLLLLSITFLANGQNEAYFSQEGGNSFLSIKQKFDKKIKGSLFVNDNFELVKIDDVPQQYPARYNGYTDNFEVEHKGAVKYIVPSGESNVQIHFIASNKVYKTFKHDVNGSEKTGFFVVVSSGKNHDLVIKEQVIYVEGQEPKTPYEKYKNPELKRTKDVYYLKLKGSDVLNKIKLKNKDIIDFFGDDSGIASTLIKKNKLNVKDEKDLVQLLKLYDNQ